MNEISALNNPKGVDMPFKKPFNSQDRFSYCAQHCVIS